MWKQIAIAGAVGAAILGTGAAALAETGSSSTSGSAAPAASTSTTSTAPTSTARTGTAAKGALKGKLGLAIKNFDHGSWVSQDQGSPQTHDAIKGTVSAVSASSITVKSADGTSQTYVVTSDTAVRVKGTGKSAIGSVKVNDTVLVTGTASGSTMTAKHVLDGGAK
jgi:VCBS repeat-containing protein